MTRITLTQEHLAKAEQIARDVRARASEVCVRMARPDERKAVTKRIDPKTCRCFWKYAYVIDPYGDHPDLPDGAKCTGRMWFVAGPDGVGVSVRDLRKETREALKSFRPPETPSRGGK